MNKMNHHFIHASHILMRIMNKSLFMIRMKNDSCEKSNKNNSTFEPAGWCFYGHSLLEVDAPPSLAFQEAQPIARASRTRVGACVIRGIKSKLRLGVGGSTTGCSVDVAQARGDRRAIPAKIAGNCPPLDSPIRA